MYDSDTPTAASSSTDGNRDPPAGRSGAAARLCAPDPGWIYCRPSPPVQAAERHGRHAASGILGAARAIGTTASGLEQALPDRTKLRSEERRVGKEARSWWWTY